MQNDKVIISIIIPVYKGEKYYSRINRMVCSNAEKLKLLNSKNTIELIIVNDFPGDELSEKLFYSNDYEIHVINHNTNVGIHASKKDGLEKAKGDYILFLDQDDVISDDYCYEQYRCIEDKDAVICNVMVNGKRKYSTEGVEALDINAYKEGKNSIVSLGQVLFKRDSIPAEWIEQPLKCNGADDYYLMFMMLLMHKKMIEHRKCLYHHSITCSNLSSDFSQMAESMIEVISLLEHFECITHSEEEVIKQNIYNRVNEKKNKNLDIDQYKLLSKIYGTWLDGIEKGYSISAYLDTFGYNKIAVYGAGRMGKHLLYWLENSDVEVVAVIDAKIKGDVMGHKIISVTDAAVMEQQFEAIVVTPALALQEEIETALRDLHKPIFTLKEIISNMTCAVINCK